MTLWSYVEQVEPEPAEAGAELRELHDVLVGFPRELRSWDPLPEVEAIAAYLSATAQLETPRRCAS